MRLIEENGIRADDVEEVVVSFLPSGDSALVSRQPKTGLEGKFSIEYVVAALLLDGDLTLDTFTDAQVMRPSAQALIGKVRRETIADDKNYTGLVGHNEVTVATGRGRFHTHEDRTPGSPAWPIDDADRATKFVDCAGPTLGAEAARALLGVADETPNLADIRALTAAMAPRALQVGERRRASG